MDEIESRTQLLREKLIKRIGEETEVRDDRIRADVRIGEGGQCGGAGGKECHVRVPCGDECRAG